VTIGTCPERYADSHLATPLIHKIGEHAINSSHGKQSGYGCEHFHYLSGQTLTGKR
jgi:hypothetical protein